MVIVAGCSSSLGLRGHTQSVSGVGAHYGAAQRRSPPRDARPRTVEPLEIAPRYAPQPTYGQGGYAASAPIERGVIDTPSFDRRPTPGYRSGGVAYHQDGYGTAAAGSREPTGDGRQDRGARPYQDQVVGQAEDQIANQAGPQASSQLASPTGRWSTVPEQERVSRRAALTERDWRDEGAQRLAAAELGHLRDEQRPVTREPAGQSLQPAAAALDTLAAPPRPALPDYEKTGWALWTGTWWRGGPLTETGETFDNNRLTAAHASLPLPSYLYVTNRANGRTVLVRVNDRIAPEPGRVVVVSRLAAELLGFRAAGRTEVDIQYAGPAGQRPSGRHEMAFVEKQSWFHPGLLASPDAAPIALSTVKAPAPQHGARWDGSRR